MAADHMDAASIQSVIATKLENARRDLLDLGMRNSLLNYRLLKARGVEVVNESPADVFQILVRDGRRMTFLPVPEPVAPALPQENTTETLLPEELALRQTDSCLQTGVDRKTLDSRLLKTYYAARTHVEERGVNILYIALGMLQWYEATNSKELRRAPLLLVPVELERTSARGRFTVQYTGEDVGLNLSLAAKLFADFGIRIPEMPDVEDLDVSAYFDDFAGVIEAQTRWRIDREAIALAFFSFGKFLMYRDLDPTTWPDARKPGKHPIVSALLGTDGFREPPSAIADDAFIDPYVDLSQTYQVVDADASQTLAIMDVKAGRNLVIQGPPGTGKSQTITNLIAEAIGDGKTVLFVAEKMAALEVVKRRLDSIGLGAACLELHSNKTNKRAVLEELRQTLDLGRPQTDISVVRLEQLDDAQTRLNAYCDAVNTEIGNSGVTPYQVYGTLVSLAQQFLVASWPRMEISMLAACSRADFERRAAIVQEMQALLGRMGVPLKSPFWGSTLTVLLPRDRERLGSILHDAHSAAEELAAASKSLAATLRTPAAATRRDAERLLSLAQRIADAPNLDGVIVNAPAWMSSEALIRQLLDDGRRYAQMHATLATQVIPSALEEDLLPVRTTIAGYRDTWWRRFSRTYRRARMTLAGYCIGEAPDDIDAQIALLDNILAVRELGDSIQSREALATAVFGSRWQGTSSNWDDLAHVAEWLFALHSDIRAGTVPAELLILLSSGTELTAVAQSRTRLEQATVAWDGRLADVLRLLALDVGQHFGAGVELETLQLDDLLAHIQRWTDNADRLPDMVAFNHSAALLRAEGLDEVVSVARAWDEAPQHLLRALQRGRAALLLDRAYQERPALAHFDVDGHEQVIERFRELDQLSLVAKRWELALSHWRGLPMQVVGGQVGVLNREFQKKTRHLPIRQLIQRAGNAVQGIKPVFMMSPLSIASFIPPDSVTFDLVIFDEASQVRPVDALGAVLRGKQTVVVGDSKQLPPTSFFDRMLDVDDLDSEDASVTADMESILGLFSAQSAPSRMLRWHYRSRHESLIAVSNREFYDSRLIIFPSPDKSRSEAGLRFHHLPETTYGRGGTRSNAGEAQAVAHAVMKHARTTPQRTLGVAAFSVSQADAILDALELLRKDDPTCEAFFADHPEEPFFVKNLENVQGDERDVIFISVGYGRTADGRVAMNFGPLNSEDGERRLNVLITRARMCCEVFTNLTADDIDLNRSRARGVQALKLFLKYAQTGILDVPMASGRESDSQFEDAVRDALVSAGYEIDQQVGSAGYFIDLAVVDPQRPGRYLLGIECDGATYHSARSARDRDRLRQQVLEGLGWKIHRIWSTDWFNNPERELRGTVAAIEQARAAGGPDIPEPEEPETQITRAAIPECVSPTSTLAYQTARPRINLGWQELHAVSSRQIAQWVFEVVQVESPVHKEEVLRRIVDAAGVTRAGSRIRRAVDNGINVAVRAGVIQQRGAFLWSPDMQTPPVRDRRLTPASLRTIDKIAPEEIEQAIMQTVRNAFGMEPEQIANAALALLGISRVTEQMRDAVDTHVQVLLKSGRLSRQGTFVVAS